MTTYRHVDTGQTVTTDGDAPRFEQSMAWERLEPKKPPVKKAAKKTAKKAPRSST